MSGPMCIFMYVDFVTCVLMYVFVTCVLMYGTFCRKPASLWALTDRPTDRMVIDRLRDQQSFLMVGLPYQLARFRAFQ